MTARVIMVQGTASNVGKSVLVTALCRIFRQDGFRVAPFKSQNMSLNSYVTPDGGEIGRAQAVQADAAGVEPTVDMNPILLKPEVDSRSQVVLLGKPYKSAGAREYFQMKTQLWRIVAASLDRLCQDYDVVVIEGAGSPAEINLKESEIVNMRVALYARSPVMLVADIDKGGVFASIVGTLELLEPEERTLIKAVAINKLRGDISLLEPGLTWLEERTGIPVAGVIPYYHDIHIPEEDSVSLERRRGMKQKTEYALDIAVIGFPHISNFNDFDPLEQEEGIRTRYVEAHDPLGEPDLIILPGTKTTMADLAWLRQRGLDVAIRRLAERGTPIVGICGGYQMLGVKLQDPLGIESVQGEMDGLGLLPVTTVFTPIKETRRVQGEVKGGPGLLQDVAHIPIEGYEIHMGRTEGEHINSPIVILDRDDRTLGQPEGCIGPSGRIMGTYIHGLFHNAALRQAILHRLASWKGVTLPDVEEELVQDQEYDRLAALTRKSLNMDLIYQIVSLELPET